MAHDDRSGRGGGHGGRETQWRGDDSFGGGWGNRAPRPHRLGDRDWRGESDDPDYGAERYGVGAPDLFADEFVPGGDPESFLTARGYGDYRGGFNAGPGGFGSSSARRYTLLRQRPRGGHGDPHYAEWRRRQIEQLDRDYDEFRREHQARFDKEFGEWRERRGQQRRAIGQVAEHMEVVGSDGSHVGTVDGTSGDSVILTRSDPNAGGVHHRIPCAWVERVDDKVRLNLTAAEAMERWREEEGNRALFERGGDAGRRDRSFSGSSGES